VKLASLNALGCLVTLRLHQIKYLEHGNLPDNLDDALVFDRNNIAAIRRTIHSLHDDKLALKLQKTYLTAPPSCSSLPVYSRSSDTSFRHHKTLFSNHYLL